MKKNTLLITYTPRKGSYTKVLIDEFVQLAKGRTEIKHLDLVNNTPDLLLEKNLNLIMEWNMGKREFSEEELSVLSNHAGFIEGVLKADYIVLGFPIYNFTMPATVKAWVDAIVVSDKTFSFNPETGFEGLCGGKKALSIIVSGFNYDNSGSIKQYASPTIKQNFDFIGVHSEEICAFGVDQNRDQIEVILKEAKAAIKSKVEEWFPL